MIQQVNLYTEALRPKKTVLSLNQMAGTLMVLVLILSGVSAWLYADWKKEHQKLAQQQVALSDIETTLDGLRQKAKSWVKSEALEKANERLRAQLSRYERFGDHLDKNLVLNQAGYTPILIGLAKHKRDDLWLTRMVIHANQDGFLLEGKATTPDAVPGYLQALRAEPVFAGRSFSVFEFGLNEKKTLPYAFRLQAGGVQRWGGDK